MGVSYDTVTRSISGHATAEMQAHYSTAAAEEQRRAIGQISDLVGNSSASVNTSKKRAGKMAGRKQ